MKRLFRIAALAALMIAPAYAAPNGSARAGKPAAQMESIAGWVKTESTKTFVLNVDFAKALGFRSAMVEIRSAGVIEKSGTRHLAAILDSPQPECARGCMLFTRYEPRKPQLFWLVDMSGKIVRTAYHWTPKGVRKVQTVLNAQYASLFRATRKKVLAEVGKVRTVGK